MNYAQILPFFPEELRALLLDPSISDLMINGTRGVFADRNGVVEPVQLKEPYTNERLLAAIVRVARVLGQDLTAQNPILNTRLPDGSRVAVVGAPSSFDGPTLTIRKFNRWFSSDELIESGSLPRDVRDQVVTMIAGRKNGVIAGGTGSGKTTALATIREGAEQSGYAVEGFAPTSKAAHQLREAGISANTLQSFLKRGDERTVGDPASRHLYMLDESSLASTRQMRDFLDKVCPQDRVLVIGDIRQHQGVDAGKPFEQMQDAGMRTAQLDRIVRQRDPDLLAAVEKLSKNETAAGVAMLQAQGRVREVVDRDERISVIAKDYAAKPENTIIVSPDNSSRREINRIVRIKLQERGTLSLENHHLPTLIPRSELTGADRQWAARYQPGDVLHYTTGSKDLELKRGSYANVTNVDADNNRLTVQREDGTQVTYDPKRLNGVTAYQEIGRDFAAGERIQFTAPSRELDVSNRDIATILRINESRVTARLDGRDQVVTFDAQQMRHFDHGYAMTSHSSQGVTAERVLVNMDTRAHPELINTRFAYVSVSRASQDAQIYTNDAAVLGQRLSHDASKSSAVDFRQQAQTTQQKGKHMDNDAQHGFRPDTSTRGAATERIYTPAEHQRHYEPLNRELHADDAKHFGWKAENGTVQSYQHAGTHRHIHIDGPSGQFFDQQKNPISLRTALDRAMGAGNHNAPDTASVRRGIPQREIDQSIGI